MSEDNYKLKYIKYKNKYKEFKNKLKNITNKIIILPNEYDILNNKCKNKFEIYELNEDNNPISYIKKDYLKNIIDNDDISNDLSTINKEKEEDDIMEKKIITPEEYFILSDKNKSKFEINESDYDKFPNRVVPKNFSKIK
jgi:hypothetical protein